MTRRAAFGPELALGPPRRDGRRGASADALRALDARDASADALRALDARADARNASADAPQRLADDAVVLRGCALRHADDIRNALAEITAAAPFRHMTTPGNRKMSVAMTNCGPLGWYSDRNGYRYEPADPLTGRSWPAMPEAIHALARAAADAAGFPGFAPDACLINRYAPGTKLSLHQDKDERDLTSPIVSVSLGVPAVFLFGGRKRKDPLTRVRLEHGDVVVWGGSARLNYHGIATLVESEHPFAGPYRINLTLRRAR